MRRRCVRSRRRCRPVPNLDQDGRTPRLPADKETTVPVGHRKPGSVPSPCSKVLAACQAPPKRQPKRLSFRRRFCDRHPPARRHERGRSVLAARIDAQYARNGEAPLSLGAARSLSCGGSPGRGARAWVRTALVTRGRRVSWSSYLGCGLTAWSPAVAFWSTGGLRRGGRGPSHGPVGPLRARRAAATAGRTDRR
jgi:hypothetical protein